MNGTTQIDYIGSPPNKCDGYYRENTGDGYNHIQPNPNDPDIPPSPFDMQEIQPYLNPTGYTDRWLKSYPKKSYDQKSRTTCFEIKFKIAPGKGWSRIDFSENNYYIACTINLKTFKRWTYTLESFELEIYNKVVDVLRDWEYEGNFSVCMEKIGHAILDKFDEAQKVVVEHGGNWPTITIE